MADVNRVPITIAGIALGACALAGIAYALGWWPGHVTFESFPATMPKTAAASAPKTAPAPSDIALLPGETLVAPPGPVASPPSPPAPAPVTPAPSPPKYTKPPPRHPPPPTLAQRPAPAPPQYSRAERRGDSYERSRSVCINCGVVTGISRNDYDWEVRVRFDDGSRRRLRYYDRPRVDIGDAVRLEDERLVPD